MSKVNESKVLKKVVAMFRPNGREKFLDFKGSEVICGPNDRGAMGFDTYFPKQWLMEDFGFTPAEADWFIDQVKKASRVRK